MKSLPLLSLLALGAAVPPAFPAPSPERPLRELSSDYFPLHDSGPITAVSWAQRRQEIRHRVLLAAGLFPLPMRTPLNAVRHGRIERDDYTIDRVFFESFPGHYVTGNLYLPRRPPGNGRMPGILCPHGHWPEGRFLDRGAGSAETLEQLAIGAERFENGARSPLQARCVQLARMGCAVFFYDMLGYADSIQIPNHRDVDRQDLRGTEPGTYGLNSPMADARLMTNFGLQTWNSIRALDFLLTVSGVDPARLSCTGASGGGTQTMILAAIEDRLATAFPCVMVSTAMQGGCLCENACYLRINQGNIDIAAAFAPKPMGLTAADDWTKELSTKGYPDLQRVWGALGAADDLMATFNIHWKHNYNHVSRTAMYGFMNRHFQLGFPEPVLERDFVFSPPAELTVWAGAYPKPTGDRAGGAHEKALLRHWAEDSDGLLVGRKDLVEEAWQIIVGRQMPGGDDVSFDVAAESTRGDHVLLIGTVHDRRYGDTVPVTVVKPGRDAGTGTTVLWLADGGLQSLGIDGARVGGAAKRLLDAGAAIVFPTLYLAGVTEQPRHPKTIRDATNLKWRASPGHVYGFNPPLVVRRTHDVMNVVAALGSSPALKASRVILAGTDGAGPVAAVAAAMLNRAVAGAVIDTGGFRFAAVEDQFDPLFVPGAVKYGDLPALLALSQSLDPVVLGEAGARGGTDATATAALRLYSSRP